MLRRRDAIFFVCAFFAALVLLLPMRVLVRATGLAEQGVAARDATGTLWSVTLHDAQVGPVRFGDLDARFGFAPLLLGRATLRLSDAAGRSGASLFASPWGFGFQDVDSRFATGGLLAPLPLAAFELEDAAAVFGGGQCVEARGLVRAVASPAAGAIGLPQGFNGTPRCEGALVLLPLASASGMETIDLRIDSTGRYEAVVRVRTSDPSMAARLAAAGFRRTSRGYASTVRGSF